jgi:hypothetical protein
VEPHRTSRLLVRAPREWATYDWRVGSSLKASLGLDDLSDAVDEHTGVRVNGRANEEEG